MTKIEDSYRQASRDHDEALSKIMDLHPSINQESIFEKGHYKTAKMIPDFVDRMHYCDAVIDVYKRNVAYLYEEHTLNDFSKKHRDIVAICLIAAGVIALSGQLSLTLIGGGILYAYLGNRQLRKSIERMDFHEWHIDSIVELNSDIKKLEALKKRGAVAPK
ncbi:MAG: hypothetical protein V7742_21265 [Halioglobus sp.]